MSESVYSERIKTIEGHIEIINSEMGKVKTDIAVIKSNWNTQKWIIGVNVILWVAVLGKLIVG